MKISNNSQEKIDPVVGMRLKKRRLMLGISQEELSKAVNLSIKQIEKYENATSPIASSILYFFAKLLNAPVEYFISEDKINKSSGDYTENDNYLLNIVAEDKEEYSAPLNEGALYATEQEISFLLRVFTKIRNPQIRRKIVELIELMIDCQGNKI